MTHTGRATHMTKRWIGLISLAAIGLGGCATEDESSNDSPVFRAKESNTTRANTAVAVKKLSCNNPPPNPPPPPDPPPAPPPSWDEIWETYILPSIEPAEEHLDCANVCPGACAAIGENWLGTFDAVVESITAESYTATGGTCPDGWPEYDVDIEVSGYCDCDCTGPAGQDDGGQANNG